MHKQSCDADQLALSGVGDKGENEWTVKKFPFAHLVIVGLPIKNIRAMRGNNETVFKIKERNSCMLS